MNIFRFLDWEMYQAAKKLNRYVGRVSERFSYDAKKKYYGQFNRAALSICLNIAEGAGRYTDSELCRFLDIALGSIAELVACSDNLKDEGYLYEAEFNEIRDQCLHLAKQVQGLKYSAYRHPKTFKKRVGFVE